MTFLFGGLLGGVYENRFPWPLPAHIAHTWESGMRSLAGPDACRNCVGSIEDVMPTTNQWAATLLCFEVRAEV